jgi:putative Mg2+ transporter-C (MgtC) family protein
MEHSVAAGEVLLRVLLALVPAALIGIERELGQQPAGLRTHVLVALGACLFTLAGVGIAGSDPTRIAAQVASGIGFLGAGAIIRDRFRIKGLTTAASLWVTAAIGVAAGLGAYVAGGITAAVALLVLVPLKWVEREIFPDRPTLSFTVRFDGGLDLREAVNSLSTVLGPVIVHRVEPTPDGGNVIHGERRGSGNDIIGASEGLTAMPSVDSAELQEV